MLWIDDPSVLWDITKLRYFVPAEGMTWQQQANAIVRFIFYLSLIMYLYGDNPLTLFVPLGLVMGIQYYLHTTNQLRQIIDQWFYKDSTTTEGYQNYPSEEIDRGFLLKAANNENFDPENLVPEILKEEYSQAPIPTPAPTDGSIPITSPADTLGHSPEAPPPGPQPTEPYQTLGARPDIGMDRKPPPMKPMDIECKASTKDNPFGNALPFDSIDRQITKPCPDEYAKDKNFYKGLFNGVDDLFQRNNGQMIFNTTAAPTRINDREAAIQFFYNTPYTEH